MKYRKKPVVIDAIQWNGFNLGECTQFCGDAMKYDICDTAYKVGVAPPAILMQINTPEGWVYATEGDYLCKGVMNEFYPCKPDIFEMSYDKVED